jgi:hypothetical protein
LNLAIHDGHRSLSLSFRSPRHLQRLWLGRHRLSPFKGRHKAPSSLAIRCLCRARGRTGFEGSCLGGDAAGCRNRSDAAAHRFSRRHVALHEIDRPSGDLVISASIRRRYGSPRRAGAPTNCFSKSSNLDSVRKQSIAPFIEWPHEIRLGMDRLPFAGKPFSAVGFERKMFDVVIAGFFPMFDR